MYYGKHKIKKIEDTKFGDLKFKKVILANGEEAVMSGSILASAQSTKKIDDTKLRELETKPVLADLLAVLLKHNVKVTQVNYIIQRLVQILQDHRNQADDLYWGKPEEKKAMLDIHQKLTEK